MHSYEELLSQMTEAYREYTGTEPDDASDIGIRLKVLAGELFAAYAELNWLENQMFPDTAAGSFLEKHAFQRGLTRKQGTKAEGDVDFYLQYTVSYDIQIPQGTVVATEGADPVRFETTQAAVVTSGSLSVNVPIRALETGSRGNVSVQKIRVLVTPVSGIVRVQNDYRTENGTDVETDEQLRKRVLDSYVHIPNGTNKAYYIREAMAVNGVAAAGIIPRYRGPGTVDVLIADTDGNAPQTLINEVQTRLERAREINVDVQVRALTIIPCEVYLELAVISGYSFEQVSAGVRRALSEYFSTLGGGQTAYLSEMGEAITHVDGVKNFTFVHNMTSDIAMRPDCAARCGTVTITERE